MTDFRALLGVLHEGGVELIIVGGAAATAHGAVRLTLDLDIVYRRSDDNIARLVKVLAPHKPYLRGAPPNLPFIWAAATIKRGLNFTLVTDLGDLDLLGEITGGGGFDVLRPHTIRVSVFGTDVLCLDLESLIRVKRAAGRPKDLEAIAELEQILTERRR
jgi:hypothetical protein